MLPSGLSTGAYAVLASAADGFSLQGRCHYSLLTAVHIADSSVCSLSLTGACCALLQVLVYHDLLGMMSHPHHAKVTPKFCKRYAEVGQVIQSALAQYRQDVEAGTFPDQQFSPYKIPMDEVQALVQQLEDSGMAQAAKAVHETALRHLPGQQAATPGNGSTAVNTGVGGSTAHAR